jgi:hypothetical protein
MWTIPYRKIFKFIRNVRRSFIEIKRLEVFFKIITHILAINLVEKLK